MVALSLSKRKDVFEVSRGQQSMLDALFIVDGTKEEEDLQCKSRRGRLVVVVSTLLWQQDDCHEA